jgi:hypothetical protein
MRMRRLVRVDCKTRRHVVLIYGRSRSVTFIVISEEDSVKLLPFDLAQVTVVHSVTSMLGEELSS